MWHVTWVNGQGQEIEIAAWLRVAGRILINGVLGVAFVGSVVFSSYQLINSSQGGAMPSVEFAAVPFVSGVIAGEIRRRRRHAFRTAIQATYILIMAGLVAGMPFLLYFSRFGRSPVNAFDVAAAFAAFLLGLLALSLRFDDFRDPD